MWPFKKSFDPRTTVLGLLAGVRFAALSREQRITYTNLLTTEVSDLVVACELDEIAHYLLDYSDRWNRNGRTFDAFFGGRRATIVSFRSGTDWECGMTALILGGAKRIIHLGVCGSLQEHVGLGDLVVPRTAVVNDDLSRCYTSEAELPCKGPMFEFVEKRAPELAGNVPVHFVRAISAPTFFHQTQEMLLAWQKRADVVDREVAATAALAAHHGCEWLAAFVVADRRLQDEEMFTMPNYPMSKLFDHGGIMLRAIAEGIRLFNK